MTDAGFSSTAETSGNTKTGRIISQLYESTPHSNGYSQTSATLYPNGAVGTLSGQGSSYSMPYLTYGVDGEGRPATATDATNSLNLVTATTYNAAGAPAMINMGNGDTDMPGYDYFYRSSGFTFNVAGSSPFTISGALTLNTNSSIKQMTINDGNDSTKNQTCSYSMDDLNRLNSANCGSVWSQTFAYDPFGNISKSANAGTNYAALYGGQFNQVTGGTTAAYDANGNQVQNTAGIFGWNAAAQLVSTSMGSGTAAQAFYDALGRMVETVSGSTSTQFVYSPLGTQLAVVQNGTLMSGLVPLPGGDTAVYNSAGLNYIRHTDMLGSSRLATTWNHAIYSKDAYAPYGEPYDETATTDRSFTGQDSDLTQNAGMYDFQFRKLDSTSGRWLSPDPSGWSAVDLTNPQSLNRYAYANNSPLASVDPLGLDTYWIVVTCSQPTYAVTSTIRSSTNGGTSSYWVPVCIATVYNISSGGVPPNLQNQGYYLNGPSGLGQTLGTQPVTIKHAPNRSPSPVDQANSEFNQCVAKKTQPAAASSYVNMFLDKEGKGNISMIDVVVPAGEGVLDANQDCMTENPLAILSSQYRGLFGASDLPVWWHGIDIHYF
jgi:RHS repeat-associated protein